MAISKQTNSGGMLHLLFYWTRGQKFKTVTNK